MSAGTLPSFMRNYALTTACAAFSFVVPASRGVPRACASLSPAVSMSRCLWVDFVLFFFIFYIPPFDGDHLFSPSLSLFTLFLPVEWTLVHWT